jgi:hypothetical protein
MKLQTGGVLITKTRGDRIVETVGFFPEKCTLPFPSPQDLATQAAADLSRAILHPQPAGPFCQVGDAQTLALKRLAAIFEGATRRRTNIIVPPTEKGATMHLRGCIHMFHLRGCQTQRHIICLLITTDQHTQLQIHIDDNEHL